MSTSAGNLVRPKYGVWKYFKFDEQARKSICSYCEAEISRARR